MSIFDYIKDQLGRFLFSLLSGLTIIMYTAVLGIQRDIVILILSAFMTAFVIFWTVSYIFARRKFGKLDSVMDGLDKKYYIADIIRPGLSYEDKFYKELIRRACKNMIDDINDAEKRALEHEEYIANWIHEVKTPLTAIQLICDNGRSDVTDRIKLETKRIEMNVERMMYYSKSGETWKDYIISKQRLGDIIESSIMKVYQIFIHNNVRIENELDEEFVYTDPKWSSFIMTQLLLNCVQYKREDPVVIRISAERDERSVSLVIEDNGLGIKSGETEHIFDKGYVGTNGRKNERSSGMGLYICKKLCDKLDIGIRTESEYGKYTRMILTYGNGNFCINNE